MATTETNKTTTTATTETVTPTPPRDMNKIYHSIYSGNFNDNDTQWLDGSQIPNFSVKDYINDRVNFQKSLSSMTNDPGWFYFKIFFNFNTEHGLLGNIINRNQLREKDTNSAWDFLNSLGSYYRKPLLNRSKSLERFVKSLSFISCNSPWFFNKVKGINNVQNKYNFNELTKENTIEIECTQDAIDMRLETLLSLYKYSCYDVINQREIIPQNLRKFDMDIMTFNIPLRYYQTGFRYKNNKQLNSSSFKYKSTSDVENLMSFKLFQFKNCEFKIDDLTSTPSDFTNDTSFQFGKNTIKITYDRCYEVMYNEWENMMISDFSFNQNISNVNSSSSTNSEDINIQNIQNTQKRRLNTIRQALNNQLYGTNSQKNYKSLVDVSEEVIQDAMINIKGKQSLGNLYEASSQFKDQQPDTSTIQGLGRSVRSMVDTAKKIYDNTHSIPKVLENEVKKNLSVVQDFKEGYNNQYDSNYRRTTNMDSITRVQREQRTQELQKKYSNFQSNYSFENEKKSREQRTLELKKIYEDMFKNTNGTSYVDRSSKRKNKS